MNISEFLETDPEFIERFDNFAFNEVVNHDDLDDKTRFMAILATLLGCQGSDEFRAMLPPALNFGVTPIEVKEIVYQAVAYLGMGRVFPEESRHINLWLAENCFGDYYTRGGLDYRQREMLRLFLSVCHILATRVHSMHSDV